MLFEEIIKSLKDNVTEDIDKSTFSSFYNLFILPAAQITEPVYGLIEQLDNIHSLRDVDLLTEDQMDKIAANFLIFRNQGNTGTLSVQAVLKEQKELNISPDTTFTVTVGGSAYTFTTSGVHLNASQFIKSIKYNDSFLTLPFDVVSTSTDDQLNNIEIGSSLSSNINDPNVLRYIVSSVKVRTVQQESNRDLFLRMINSVGTRNFNSTSGIVGILAENFPQVSVTHVFGADDLQVKRDKITFFITSDEWTLHNFRGKIAGDGSVPHAAYSSLLLDGDYTTSGNYIIPLDPSNYMEVEASQDDYDGLYNKWDTKYFTTGYNNLLPKEAFITDTEWTASDATMGFGKLISSDEVVISGLDYVIGRELDMYDYYGFAKSLMEIK